MRDIKFRAWDLDNFAMFYSDKDHDNGEGPIVWELDRNGVRFLEQQIIDSIVGGEHDQRSQYVAPKQVVMQFTGLKDKKGCDVFEGDIIKTLRRDWINVERDTRTGNVIYLEDAFVISLGKNEFDECLDCIPLYRAYGQDRFEIIGNIYQNPELVKP